MATTTPSHASLHKRTGLTIDPTTGECRIPVGLYQLDRHYRDVLLVLSRRDGRRLLDALLAALGLPTRPVREATE